MNPNDSTRQKQPSPKTARNINIQRPASKISISPNNFYGSPMPMGAPKAVIQPPVNPVKGPGGPSANENLRDLTNKSK